jgi:hypothetical protein
MQTSTVLLIILAAVVTLGLVLFQYYYKSKKRGKLNVLLSFLRFIGLFGLFLLLINPKFAKNEYRIEKANLIVLVDNTSSIGKFKNETFSAIEKIKSNSDLTNRFDIRYYAFGNSLEETDSLSFAEHHTNIAKTLKSINDVYANSNATSILLSDGNSTIGEDYIFSAKNLRYPVFPITLGDTIRYEDIRIDQVNTNKYAFLKNKYPIEVYISYNGDQDVSSTLNITVNKRNIYRQNIKLTSANNTKTIRATIDANTVGLKNISVSVSPLISEKNVQNNNRNVVVEVIDEKTNIAIISDIMHPDIGALRKSIESNEQRTVSIKKSNVNHTDIENVDVFILYQPTTTFTSLYSYIKQKKASLFTITGGATNWNSSNQTLDQFNVESGYPNQEIFGVLNPSFTKFDITDFDIIDFPPLESNAGPVGMNDLEMLLQMKIQGRTTGTPLLFAIDNDKGKELLLLGENIWKWRMQSYRKNQGFQNFDDFMGKLMLYLSSNKGKTRLEIDYQSVYEGSTNAKIRASYFDEAFVFDTNASLVLTLRNKDKGVSKEIPMLLKNNNFEADLSDLLPGQYTFTVKVLEENRTKSGSFTILDFDVEQQFSSSDFKKLQQLASATNGEMYFPNKADDLIQSLISDSRFVPTQKGTKNIVSLIDFRVLLAIIIAALSAEWFIRKFNGLT